LKLVKYKIFQYHQFLTFYNISRIQQKSTQNVAKARLWLDFKKGWISATARFATKLQYAPAISHD